MAYPPWTGWGCRATMEATITTDPPPRSRMDGSAARVIWSEPKRLVSMILRQMREIDLLEALEGIEAEGVVHQHVDAPERLGGGLHQRARRPRRR